MIRSLLLTSLSAIMVASKRVKCPPGTLSEGQIVSALFSNYTKMLPEGDSAVEVQIEMHIQDMGSLNEITSDFEIDILFTQLWRDESLSFSHMLACKRNITMEPRLLQRIWTPNTCLINSKRTMIHASPSDNVMIILYENGTVWINHRLSVKSPCNLDLRQFPFDVQSCILILESYSHNAEEVQLRWMEEAVTLMKPIQLPDFDMVHFETKKENLLYPNGYWDQLQVVFTFKRRYGFYIIQAYVPTYLTIIVSWVSFCMEPKALPARTTVGISSLLALTFQFGNILKNLPRVSYVKAMDVWMLGCISFVFGTMVELAFVCYISRCQNSVRSAERRRERIRTSQIWSNGSCRSRVGHAHSNGNGSLQSANGCTVNRSTLSSRAPPSTLHLHMTTFDSETPLTFEQLSNEPERPLMEEFRSPSPATNVSCIARFHPEAVDKFSIVAFPLAFTLFNLVYWWHYLSQTFDYKVSQITSH
ncbi:hypothetical protein Y032_0054g2449 [Ancylostoma ceylanicum]|uniref:Cation transporter family protein n=1 Tax=Ancylostoma ceylanicum TaxID=53326 RepID=A0A016U5M1_9BILA|nr:hypothetical protein Y032_0054g2449 [Ancylostoma ceylanicum]